MENPPRLLDLFLEFLKLGAGAFATFLGLLLYMTIKFALLVPWDVMRAVIALLAFVALIKRVDTFVIVLAGAVVSLFIFR